MFHKVTQATMNPQWANSSKIPILADSQYAKERTFVFLKFYDDCVEDVWCRECSVMGVRGHWGTIATPAIRQMAIANDCNDVNSYTPSAK